jgi:hypothetical protein
MTRGAIAPHSPDPLNPNAVHEPNQNRDATGAKETRVRCSGCHTSVSALNKLG